MERSTTRRGLLAAAGTALLAGCSELDPGGDDVETLSSYRIPDYTDEGSHGPVVVEQFPLEIDAAELAARAERTTALLGRLPLPLTDEDIPNGYVRERLLDAAENATDRLDEARNARSQFEALEHLRGARSEARYAAAGWAYAQGETTESALEAEHDEAVTDAETLRGEQEYRGEDPVRAAVVHATVERNLAYVADDRDPSYRADGSLLSVAEWGEHAEDARANVADSRYLYERFLDSLPENAGSVDGTLAAAAERVASDLEARREALEPTPTDVYDQPFYRIRDRLRGAVEYGPKQVSDAPGPASALLTATEKLVDAMAYDRVVERLESDDGIELEEATDVQEIRETAVEALETGLAESSRPMLVRPVLADAAQLMAYADAELARLHGDVRVSRLEDAVGWYVGATARGRSAPAACEQVLDALAG